MPPFFLALNCVVSSALCISELDTIRLSRSVTHNTFTQVKLRSGKALPPSHNDL